MCLPHRMVVRIKVDHVCQECGCDFDDHRRLFVVSYPTAKWGTDWPSPASHPAPGLNGLGNARHRQGAKDVPPVPPSPSMPPNALAHKSLHEGAIAHCSSLISLLWSYVHRLEHTLLVCTCYSFSLEHFPFTLPSSPHPTSTSTSTWLTPTHFQVLG